MRLGPLPLQPREALAWTLILLQSRPYCDRRIETTAKPLKKRIKINMWKKQFAGEDWAPFLTLESSKEQSMCKTKSTKYKLEGK